MEENLQQLDELLVCRLDEGRKSVQPCTVVIFGASGDLTIRKLIPALYHLASEKQLPDPYRIIGVARREKTSDSWRDELKAGLDKFSRTKPLNETVWTAFAANVDYCQGDLESPDTYRKLAASIADFPHDGLRKNLVFYLAISPSQFSDVMNPGCCTRTPRASICNASLSKSPSDTTSSPPTLSTPA
jgi:glucose-6-phosphate 1-dehydrogenase